MFALEEIFKNNSLSIDDLKIICAHSHVQHQFVLNDFLLYCKCFEFVAIQNNHLSALNLEKYMSSPDTLNRYLVEESVGKLFDAEIFTPKMFSFDIANNKILFHNEMLPLVYAPMRNLLVSQDFFIIERSLSRTIFYINNDYEKVLSFFSTKYKKKITLNQLQEQLRLNAEVGEKAEKFVLDYERRRLGNNYKEKIKIISNIDVGAGYDIVSFNSKQSVKYDRFIEVKAVSAGDSFYWSNNEFNVAKLLGEQYYLYLVSLSEIEGENYAPTIISNPAQNIMSSTDWFIEPSSFYISRISL